MAEELFAGVINPYALAEVTLGRTIDWKRVAAPRELLERTLRAPYGQLFDPSFRTLPYAFADVRQGKAFRRSTNGAASPIDRLRRLDISGAMDLPEQQLSRLASVLTPGPQAEGVPPGTVWVDPGDYYEEGAEYFDPIQGALGDCYFIAALSSVAWSRPYVLVHRVRNTGPGQQDFVDRIDFAPNVAVEVTEKLPLRGTDRGYIYARSREPGEIWPAVYEKAYAKWRTGGTDDQPNYDPLNGGDPAAACCALVPGTTATYVQTRTTTAEALFQMVRANSLSRRTVNPMTAWTYARGEDSPDKIKYDEVSGIVGWHAYSVLGWDYADGASYIVLRNPWGLHEGKVPGAIKPGTWSAYEVSFWRNISLNQDGLFAIKADAFKMYFAMTAVAR